MKYIVTWAVPIYRTNKSLMNVDRPERESSNVFPYAPAMQYNCLPATKSARRPAYLLSNLFAPEPRPGPYYLLPHPRHPHVQWIITSPLITLVLLLIFSTRSIFLSPFYPTLWYVCISSSIWMAFQTYPNIFPFRIQAPLRVVQSRMSALRRQLCVWWHRQYVLRYSMRSPFHIYTIRPCNPHQIQTPQCVPLSFSSVVPRSVYLLLA